MGASFTVRFEIASGERSPRTNRRSATFTVATVACPVPCATPPSISKALSKSAPSTLSSRAFVWSVMAIEASSTESCFSTMRRGTAAAAGAADAGPRGAARPSLS